MNKNLVKENWRRPTTNLIVCNWDRICQRLAVKDQLKHRLQNLWHSMLLIGGWLLELSRILSIVRGKEQRLLASNSFKTRRGLFTRFIRQDINQLIMSDIDMPPAIIASKLKALRPLYADSASQLELEMLINAMEKGLAEFFLIFFYLFIVTIMQLVSSTFKLESQNFVTFTLHRVPVKLQALR